MRRPVGVTAAAVILGIMALLGAGLMLLSLLFSLFVHSPLLASPLRPFVALGNALVLCFFLYCGWTVVDLFRMRRWARISAVVIGALVFLTSGVTVFGILAVRQFVPAPPGTSPEDMMAVFMGLAAFYVLICLVGLWWVVYFNLRHVRAAFADSGVMVTNPDILPPGGAVMLPPSGEGTPGWRIVIIVWAILVLFSALVMPVTALMHTPLFLFGAILTGPAETGTLLVLAAIEIYMGVGLLRKWKAAWYVALFWQIYCAVFFLSLTLSGVRSRFLAYDQQLMARWSSTGGEAYPATLIPVGSFMAIGMILGGIFVIIVTIALIQRRDDYRGY